MRDVGSKIFSSYDDFVEALTSFEKVTSDLPKTPV